MLGVVSQDVLLLIGIAQLHGLLANQVINVSLLVGVHKAVGTHPQATHNNFPVLFRELKSLFTPIVVLFRSCSWVFAIQVGGHLVIVVGEKVEVLIKCENHRLSVVTPEHIFRSRTYIYSPHHNLVLPIVESYEFLASHTQKMTTENCFNWKTSIENFVFLEIFVNLYGVRSSFDSKYVLSRRNGGPNQVRTISEGSIGAFRE